MDNSQYNADDLKNQQEEAPNGGTNVPDMTEDGAPSFAHAVSSISRLFEMFGKQQAYVLMAGVVAGVGQDSEDRQNCISIARDFLTMAEEVAA